MTDGEDGSDEDSGYGPVRSSNLKKHLKKQTEDMRDGEDMWVGDDSMKVMEDRLLEIAKWVWVSAATETDLNDRRIVQPKEIDDAFDDLFEAQNLLLEAANEMRSLRWRFIDLAEESPAIDFDRDQQEDE